MGNQFRTFILLGAMTLLIVFIGKALGGQQGMIMAFILALGMNFFSYWFSDKIVLKMYRAQEITPQQAPDLYRMVEELARRAQLPMPKVYLIPQDTPNAFATGRNPEHAVVAVTQGLLQLMEPEEVRGVLAHELAHVNNRDILIGSIAATLSGAIMIMANMAKWGAIFGGHRGGDARGGGGLAAIALAIIAPIAAMVIQMAISRRREYLADATGAKFAGHSEGLARALEKLGGYSRQKPMQANPSTAHMFIVNPLSGRSLMSLFSTHPPLEERIARLRGSRSAPQPPGETQNAPRQNLSGGQNFWDRMK
jgi:heat shock protein HtpX